jgi:hypothetical protein
MNEEERKKVANFYWWMTLLTSTLAVLGAIALIWIVWHVLTTPGPYGG